MREVIYLSEGKLNEFLPEPRRVRPVVKLRASVPFAGLDVETPAPNNMQDLRRHLKQVEKKMARHALLHTDPNLEPGRWVMFEARLNWFTLRGRYRDLVLFVDSERSHEAVSTRRLLLHGSARHLRGSKPVQVDGPTLAGLEDGGNSSGTIFVTNAGHVVNALAYNQDVPALESTADEENSPEPAAPLHRLGVRDLLAALDAESTEVSTSAVVSGLARVSAVLPETAGDPGCLVASPLIVEYVKQQP
ncbi:SAVMC3_10250 family protein [Kitasatospora sp. NPDC059817]|uniref:SAVMC3_10250 family protein n=1 Tax=Kitasatospora sp. NPDC059817 TaxID=3346961 RepID=UPI00365E916F